MYHVANPKERTFSGCNQDTTLGIIVQDLGKFVDLSSRNMDICHYEKHIVNLQNILYLQINILMM